MNKEQDQREQRKRARVCDRGADKAGQHREREREATVATRQRCTAQTDAGDAFCFGFDPLRK